MVGKRLISPEVRHSVLCPCRRVLFVFNRLFLAACFLAVCFVIVNRSLHHVVVACDCPRAGRVALYCGHCRVCPCATCDTVPILGQVVCGMVLFFAFNVTYSLRFSSCRKSQFFSIFRGSRLGRFARDLAHSFIH